MDRFYPDFEYKCGMEVSKKFIQTFFHQWVILTGRVRFGVTGTFPAGFSPRFFPRGFFPARSFPRRLFPRWFFPRRYGFF